MKCKHYDNALKKGGFFYKYELDSKEVVLLCSECEMFLLSEMKKQEVLENKAQAVTNAINEETFDALNCFNKDVLGVLKRLSR